MKNSLLKRSLLKAMTIAVVLSYPALNFAAESEQLIGKNLQQNKDLVDKIMEGRNHVLELDQQGQIKQVLDTGANGDGSEPLNPTPSNTAASNQTKPAKLLINYQGQEAIDFLGTNLNKTAARYNISEEQLKSTLLQDDTLRISENGNLLYIETTNHQASSQQHENSNNADNQPAMLISGSQAISTTTLTQASLTPPPNIADAFKLHSKKGSNRTIYLNFLGKTILENTGIDWTIWYGEINLPTWDLNNNSAVFDTNERNTIIQTWQTVSAIYSAFDIDVTTEKPSAADLNRSSGSGKWGTEVIITNNDEFFGCGCLGIGWVGYFGQPEKDPTFVFSGTETSGKIIGRIASHEIGHRLGMLHDGDEIGVGYSYYSGHGTGETGWAPIMGNPVYQNVTQFSFGEYPKANNKQNDLMEIKAASVNPGKDDHGNSTTNPSSLVFSKNPDGTVNINTPGVIETSDDIDMFVIKTDYPGLINLSALPDAVGPTLDIEISLFNASGQLLQTNKPETTLSASLNYPNAPAGTYFVSIKNSGHTGTGSDYGYTKYASLGRYTITGSYPLSTIHTAPTPLINASAVSGTAPFTVNFSSGSSSSDGAITNYYWDFDDKYFSTTANPNNSQGSSASHIFTKVGQYKVTLVTRTQYQITAKQEVTINVTRPSTTKPIGIYSFLFLKNATSISIQANGLPLSGPYMMFENLPAGLTSTLTGKVTKPDGSSEIITNSDASCLVYTLTNKPAHGSLTFEVLDISYTYTKNGQKVQDHLYDPAFNREQTTKTFTW